jgi:O-antigen/teichoic acid export membrane protein
VSATQPALAQVSARVTPSPTSGSALLRYVSMSLGASLTIQVLNVATGVLTARMLGPAGKGELTAVMLWPGLLASLGFLGLTDAITYFASQKPARGQAILGTGLVAALVQSTVLMTLGYALLPHVMVNFDPATIEIARLCLWWIPLNMVTLYAMSLLSAQLRFAAYNVVRLSVIAATFGGLVWLMSADVLSVEHATYVYLAANGVTMVLALALCARRVRLTLQLDPGLLRRLLGFGLRAHVSSLAAIINTRGDQTMVSIFLPPVQLGLYAVAGSLTWAVTLIVASIAPVIMPSILVLSDQPSRVHRLGQLTRACLALSMLAAVVLFPLASLLIVLFFGAAFEPVTDVARLLLLAAVITSGVTPMSFGLKAFGLPTEAALADLAGLVTMLTSLLIFLPTLGLIGAGLAPVLAAITTLICLAVAFHCRLGVPFSQLIRPTRGDATWILGLVRRRLLRDHGEGAP